MAENVNTCCCGNDCDCRSRHYVGEVMKVVVTPSAEGFDPSEDDWSVEVRWGVQRTLYKTYTKADMIEWEGKYVIVIDTTGMVGELIAIVRVYIPDDDCDNGIRMIPTVVSICTLNALF